MVSRAPPRRARAFPEPPRPSGPRFPPWVQRPPSVAVDIDLAEDPAVAVPDENDELGPRFQAAGEVVLRSRDVGDVHVFVPFHRGAANPHPDSDARVPGRRADEGAQFERVTLENVDPHPVEPGRQRGHVLNRRSQHVLRQGPFWTIALHRYRLGDSRPFRPLRDSLSASHRPGLSRFKCQHHSIGEIGEPVVINQTVRSRLGNTEVNHRAAPGRDPVGLDATGLR